MLRTRGRTRDGSAAPEIVTGEVNGIALVLGSVNDKGAVNLGLCINQLSAPYETYGIRLQIHSS